MSYTPTNWHTGDEITAVKLNNIEQGIGEINMSYEPTTWAIGDIITATKLNKMEQGIAGAGSGDFSTADVTFVNTGSTSYQVYTPAMRDDGTESALYGRAQIDVGNVSPRTITVPLYKGKFILPLDDICDTDTSVMPTTSGNVTIDLDNLCVVVTGDGTFTTAGNGGVPIM